MESVSTAHKLWLTLPDGVREPAHIAVVEGPELDLTPLRPDSPLFGASGLPVRLSFAATGGGVNVDGVMAGGDGGRVRVRMLSRPVPGERRRSPRAAADLAVEIAPAGGDPVAGRLVDISRDGCAVEAPLDLAPGSLVRVVIGLPDGGELLLTATVVRIAGEGRIALTFVLVPARERDALVERAFACLLEAA